MIEVYNTIVPIAAHAMIYAVTGASLVGIPLAVLLSPGLIYRKTRKACADAIAAVMIVGAALSAGLFLTNNSAFILARLMLG